MKASIESKLAQLSARWEEINRLLASEQVTSDLENYRRLTMEHAEIGPVVELFQAHRRTVQDLAAAQEMAQEPEMRAFAEDEVKISRERLAEIEAQPYRILLTQAEGQFEQSAAQLDVARSDLERLRPLMERNLVTAQQIEVQQALVREREGVLSANRARVEDARLQLAYTRIEAPISGRLGLRQVDAGNLVRAGDANGLAVITQTRPISVLFTIPEVDLLTVLEPIRRGEQLAVEAWDRSEEVRLAAGVLRTVDNQIDLATGTLKLKAEFANADDRLFPNQFVNVRLRVRTIEDAIVIPSSAVQFGSRGTYVFVIGADNTATVRDLVLGPADGLLQSVQSGLAAGELVVLEGLDRLREGRKVILVDDNRPAVSPGS